MTDRKLELQEAANFWRNKALGIQEDYGTGVRPSWVSAELSLAWAQYNNCKAELERISE